MSDMDENFNHISEDTIGDVEDVSLNKDKGSISIKFNTTFGTSASLVTPYSQFKKWFASSQKKDSPYKRYLKDFIRVSNERKEGLEEIIDDDGNIIDDEDMPPNTTNTMVGTSKWDTDHVYRSTIPKSIRMYSGDLGIGIITW